MEGRKEERQADFKKDFSIITDLMDYPKLHSIF